MQDGLKSDSRAFMAVTELRGAAFVICFRAASERDAPHAILMHLPKQSGVRPNEPVGGAEPPLGLDGLLNVWCWTNQPRSKKESHILANVVEVAPISAARRLTHICLAGGATLIAQANGNTKRVAARLVRSHLIEQRDAFPSPLGRGPNELRLGWSESWNLWAYGGVLGGVLGSGLIVPTA